MVEAPLCASLRTECRDATDLLWEARDASDWLKREGRWAYVSMA